MQASLSGAAQSAARKQRGDALSTPDRNSQPYARRRPARRCGGIATALLSLAILLMAGCAVQLAPSYDTTIIDGLTGANEQAMTLFASVSSGTEGSPFSDREKTYDELIGKFGALRVQALARPTPQPLILDYLGLAPSAATASEPENRLKARQGGMAGGFPSQRKRVTTAGSIQ